MEVKIKLQQGKYYHIYNRGIDGCDIFRERANYEHFLRLYDKYIDPVVSTFAWVLMRNHFHLLVRILNFEDLKTLCNSIASPDLRGFQNLEGLEAAKNFEKYVTQQFSNFFNAYAKAYNKQYQRTGSLFEHAFRRKEIGSVRYLKQVVLYIHHNPVHHGFCEHLLEYSWSSYNSCISIKPTKLQRDTVIGWFDNEANFKQMHQHEIEIDQVEDFLGIL